MIYYVVTRPFRGTINIFLAGGGKPLARHVRVLSYEELFRRRRVPVGTWIFSDLERLAREDLERAAMCWEALASSGHPVRLFNHPLRVKRRFELLRALHDCGVNEFDVHRLDEGRAPRRFPVFLRVENDHTGPETGLLRTPEEFESAVRRLASEGKSRDQRVAVEYCAEADEEGRYRKYAAFILDGQIVPRHLLVNKHWVVKGRDREACNETIPEQIEYTETNPHEAELRKIFEIAQIDYGRIDYTVVAGRIQVYEINTNPQITTPGWSGRVSQRSQIKLEFARKFLSIMTPLAIEGSKASVPVDFDPGPALQQRGLRVADALYWLTHKLGLGRLEPRVYTRMKKTFRRLK